MGKWKWGGYMVEVVQECRVEYGHTDLTWSDNSELRG